MGSTLEKDIETLKNDLGKFRDYLNSTMSDVGNYSEEKLHATKERLKSAMEDFGNTAHRRMARINETVCHRCGSVVKASREAATKKPFTTMAVSFGAGAVTAALLGRRNHG
ncbi:MAG: hypothetical protein IH624_04610 [Phycisphaerae bacterium]|nr:hypothetical protein [Phycisphaerae bacterium]